MQEPQDTVPDSGPGPSPRAGAGADAGSGSGGPKRDNDGLVLRITWAGFLAYGATIGVSIAVGSHLLRSMFLQFALIALALVTLTLLIACIVASVVYFTSDSADDRDRRRPLVSSMVLGVGVLLGIALMVVLVDTGGAGTRCVRTYDMTVVSGSECQSSARDYVNGFTEWYRGGIGTEIGDHVQGGSEVSAPGGN